MNANLTPELILMGLFFVCFMLVYCIVRYFICGGKIVIGEYGTVKYVFTIASIIIFSVLLTIIIIIGLELSGSVELLSYFFKYLGIS